MYKSPDYEYEQLNFVNFNSSCGLQLDQKNEWILISKKLPWRAWESLYEVMFPSNTGNVAKPCRMALGALIIQLRIEFTASHIGTVFTRKGKRYYFMIRSTKILFDPDQKIEQLFYGKWSETLSVKVR